MIYDVTAEVESLAREYLLAAILPERREADAVHVAVGLGVVLRRLDRLRSRAALVDDDRAGECRGVGRLLLGALRRVELPRVDRKTDREEQREHEDREENERLPLLLVAPEESTELLVHR